MGLLSPARVIRSPNFIKNFDGMAKAWYFLIYGDPLDTSSYVKIQVKHDCLCGDQICAVYAEDHGENPAPFSRNVQQYIRKALASGQLQPEFPVMAKKYVYLKY